MQLLKSISFCFCMMISFNSFSQITVTGTISSKKEQLNGANVIAKPLTEGAKFSYAISDEKGEYSLKLTPNASYKFTVSFMGYITLKENILLKNVNEIKNFVLQEDPNELEEITITYREPIVIKKDTTTYRADAFINGKERKLRQVLKKLPGVEVDRNGNVTVKGKKVTRVLVENKEFFTGDTKLAVNNIPADVIDEIQIIEDFHESELLKGFEKSEEIALNINLKKDKTQFVFGDVELGGDLKERYTFHPTIFKYSKKINYSFIGDVNNVGEKSFTLKDYINYEGGFNVNNFSSIYTSPLVRLLDDTGFNENKHIFGGLNLQLTTNEKNDWSAFVIGLKDDTASQINLSQNYLIANINEDRETLGNQQQNMLLGKIQLKSKPNKDVRIKFENGVELSTVNDFSQTNSIISSDDLNYETKDSISNFTYKSNFRIEKRFSNYHTSQAKIDVLFSENSESQSWISSENIFSEGLEVEESDIINVNNDSKLKTYQINSLLKHFWIINPKNHLFLSFKNELYINDYQSGLYQNNDTILSEFLDFKNENNNKEVFSSFTTEYKRLLGNVFFTLQLEYLNYNRFNKQFNLATNSSIQILLPNLNIDWDITNNKQLSFNYKLTNKFPTYKQLSIGNELLSFNSIYNGVLNLNESYYHNLRLSFRKSQNYGWSFYPTLRYKIIKEKLQNIYLLNQGIYNTNTPVNLNTPEKEFSTDIRIVYNYKYWKATLSTNYRNNNYISVLDELETKAINNSFTARGSFRSVYINGPNVDVSVSHTYNENENILFESISNKTKVDFTIDYEIGDWIFKAENLYDYYSNRASNTKNSFNEINASVFYKKEDSAWAFEIKAANLSNNKTQINTSLTDVLFNETRIAVFPRTVIGKIIYKL